MLCRFAWWAALLATLVLSHAASAQTCSLSVTAPNFGPADVLSGAPVDSTATATVTCSGMTVGTYVCLGFGAGTGRTNGSSRVMTGPGSLLFGLYADAGRTAPWGSRSYPALGSSYGQPSAAASATVVATIYGRIPAGQYTTPTGSYSSTLSGSDARLFALATGSSDCNAGPIFSPPAAAQTSFTVSATPFPNCILSTTAVDFGSQGLLNSAFDAVGGVTVRCTSSLPYSIALGNGNNGASSTTRKMASGAKFIQYSLYKDAPRSQTWGSSGGQLASGTGTGLPQAFSVYGRVPAQTTPAAGSYSDAVVVTASY